MWPSTGMKSAAQSNGKGVCAKLERFQVIAHFVLHLLLKLLVIGREVLCVGFVDGGLGLTAHTSNVFVVLDPVELFADHHKSSFSLVDAWEHSLVDHLATCLHSSLVVLPCSNRCPFS